ncbi:MAG: hypothetical protein H0W08_02890 [Acidobacteria bacterium]|nr:hypothetical protein [Acidobacteriota bacterium]
MLDDDAAFDASKIKDRELSEGYDFLQNTFASPGDRSPIRAVNVNTLDEVPDSSWFTNRIGSRTMSIADFGRGPNKFERLDAEEWVVVRGKGPGGFYPGFRAERPGDPGQVYQLEVDPVDRPQMASRAELIGTLIYHALGYHVEDVYTIRVDPAKIRISEKATIRDTRAAQQAPGVVRLLTSRNMPKLGKITSPPGGQSYMPLQDNRIRHEGQPIALAVAETLEDAQHAASLIRAEYSADKPVVEFRSGIDRATTGTSFAEPDTHVGDVERGFAESQIRIDQTYGDRDHADVPHAVEGPRVASGGRTIPGRIGYTGDRHRALHDRSADRRGCAWGACRTDRPGAR